jgi:nickel-dependent lactate racemase
MSAADKPSIPSLVCADGSPSRSLSDEDIRKHLFSFLDQLGPKDDVLLLPPDFTRFHSQSGKITSMIAEYYGHIKSSGNEKALPKLQIMPALGTHAPMTQEQIEIMYGKELASLDPSPFLVHDWRKDVETIGHAPNEMVREATRGMVDEPWPAQLNKLVWAKRNSTGEEDSGKTVVLSIGQVVPHEVMGMANFNKNLFVGVGGLEAINLSHFIGAVYGMENMMGKADNPLRSILNYASEKFLGQLPLHYILTVMGPNATTDETEMRGLFIGNDIECYTKACDLSLQVNFTMLEKAPAKMVVYLDEDEFHSTWLGNKAIYRTRMAIADDGELVVMAPGVRKFGEDEKVDELIRKYGYKGTPETMKAMEGDQELKDNLGAVAHLIHGSSEGRFSVTYCPGHHLTKEDIEGVGFKYGNVSEMLKRYNVNELMTGWQTDKETGEEFFFIKNPALGLWAEKSRFEKNQVEEPEAKKARTE